MNIIKNDVIISRIALSVFVPFGKGAPIHRNRYAHGLAFNTDREILYRFETGEALVCHAGEMIYLPKGSSYTIENLSSEKSEKSGTYAINFFVVSEESENRPYVIKIKGKNEITSLFSKAASQWLKRSAGFYEECFSILYRILMVVKKEALIYSPKGKALSILSPALEYINENYTKENIKIEVLARLCGISEPYLRELFRNAFSESPSVYVRNLRIKYARELLASSEYPITDVAMLSGFNDVSYFSREFRKAVGMSPKEYGNSLLK